MKRIFFGYSYIGVALAFLIYLVIKQIYFNPPWVNIIVAFGVLGMVCGGLLFIKQGQKSMELNKPGSSLGSGMERLYQSLFNLWEELEKDERYSQNPRIMQRLVELKALCKDNK